MKYTIEKCRSKEDFDNINFQPSDGGQYEAKMALEILENSNGGSMMSINKKKSFLVNYDKKQNDWLRKELKL